MNAEFNSDNYSQHYQLFLQAVCVHQVSLIGLANDLKLDEVLGLGHKVTSPAIGKQSASVT